ncbi:MAG: putative DNA binding domain-containing protein [Chloroflexi bacterium]|nr:putative DNA binding domain-containing protein [Chloroflexota bacterium]
MKAIEKILAQIESCITQNRYESIETDKIELKDLSGGVSAELYKSACAFLNAEGGMIIIGIHEEVSNKGYVLKGYNPEIENALKELPKKFTREDNSPVDLSNSFPTFEIKEFMDSRVCIVYIEKLDEEQKYVFYKGEAYKRKITADHKLTLDEIKAQNELKAELENVRELKTVDSATLDTLDVDKLNDYIVRLNREVKIETLKADIPSSRPFLTRKVFVKGDTPTLLGMLVCGKNIEDYVGGRCQVDGFVDSPIQIAENKQVLKDNIFALMERSVGFIYKNIQVGVSHAKSGTELPEYPEKLIRETVNNALAHRDYSIDKFVNIIIKPNESIEIRNPGSFREKQKLVFNDHAQNIKARRIIPMPKARNPRLADILKTFDRWEGRGIGMASLTNACLDNQIGVPCYVFHSENDISLFIPKGKTLDDKMELWFKTFSGYILRKLGGKELSEQEKIVLCYLYKCELINRLERYTILLTSDNNHFEVIANLEDKGLIFRHPQSPDIYPVFLVDRVLTQTDFTSPLRELFGQDYDDLKSDYKEVLQIIYQHNKYSLHQTINARSVGTYLYIKETPNIINARDPDNFMRKIRSIFNRLEKASFIVRSGSKRNDGKLKPEFLLNQSFTRTPSL